MKFGAEIWSGAPHTVVKLLATTSPVGRKSLKFINCATVLAGGLVIVKVKVLVPFRGIEVGLKTMATESGATTVSVSVAVLPVPPLVDVTAPVVLTKEPATVPVKVTSTCTTQELFTAMVPPVRLMLVPVVEGVPPQVLNEPGSATDTPVGSVSLNATPVSATVLAAGLVMVKISVKNNLSFSPIELGINFSARKGGAIVGQVDVVEVGGPAAPAFTTVKLLGRSVMATVAVAVQPWLSVSVTRKVSAELPVSAWTNGSLT